MLKLILRKVELCVRNLPRTASSCYKEEENENGFTVCLRGVLDNENYGY